MNNRENPLAVLFLVGAAIILFVIYKISGVFGVDVQTAAELLKYSVVTIITSGAVWFLTKNLHFAMIVLLVGLAFSFYPVLDYWSIKDSPFKDIYGSNGENSIWYASWWFKTIIVTIPSLAYWYFFIREK